MLEIPDQLYMYIYIYIKQKCFIHFLGASIDRVPSRIAVDFFTVRNGEGLRKLWTAKLFYFTNLNIPVSNWNI